MAARTLPSATVDPMVAVRLVLGVARLGEADLAGWWSSHGMNSSVAFALAGFPRTSRIVGAELALLSAERRHRQVLPRETAIHLFSSRLPFFAWTSAYMAEQKSNGGSPLVSALVGWKTMEAARAQLGKWCDDVAVAPYQATTVSAAELDDPDVQAALLIDFVGGYITIQGDLAVPYVDLVR